MGQPPFVNGQFYHVYNRGVEKRRIFNDEKDHYRFVHDLFELNDRDAVLNTSFHYHNHHRDNYRDSISIVGERRGVRTAMKKRKLLVDIVAWALMPNHYHLLLRQRGSDGISLFMKKMGIGYTLYFNKRHDRTGVLFQGTFKAKIIERDEYLRHLLMYIHLNPLDLVEDGWREAGRGFPGGPDKAMRFLESYRWSSCQDYLGSKNLPSLLQRDLISQLDLPRGRHHKELIQKWSQDSIGLDRHLGGAIF